MNFINKYAIPINSLSILFWIWMISLNNEKIQLDKTGTVSKVPLYIGIALLFLSTFNLITALLKRRKKN